MIPEEIREKLIELLRESQPLKDFESLIERAIEAEREACAQLMDEMWADASPGEAIRARGKAD